MIICGTRNEVWQKKFFIHAFEMKLWHFEFSHKGSHMFAIFNAHTLCEGRGHVYTWCDDHCSKLHYGCLLPCVWPTIHAAILWSHSQALFTVWKACFSVYSTAKLAGNMWPSTTKPTILHWASTWDISQNSHLRWSLSIFAFWHRSIFLYTKICLVASRTLYLPSYGSSHESI